jgi:DisA bacterial checkpoint controller nucleotide-binding
VRFLASLSRVDGLIWLDSRLQLKAFGMEITDVAKDPGPVFRAQNPLGTKTNKLNLNDYGTRHRTMIRYCSAYPDSVGFVVSQDGNVRAVTHSGNCALLWENVACSV